MLADFSTNAILAKSLAKYGRRLSIKDYQSLVACMSVGEIAAYLKSNTRYRSSLEDINENDIHREELEIRLGKTLFRDIESIFRYSDMDSKYFSNYLIESVSIKLLIRILGNLISGENSEKSFNVPNFIRKRAQIDFSLLMKAENYDDFLAAIKKSEYYKILKLSKNENEEINLAQIESKLYTYLYTKILNQTSALVKGKTKAEIQNLFIDMVNAQNYINIVRLKKYYRLSKKDIDDYMFPFGYFATKKGKAVLDCETEEELKKEILKTSFGKKLLKEDYNYLDETLLKLQYNTGKKNIRFSKSPVMVALSYILLLEIEIKNVIHIIEGVRYNIKKENIQRLLIMS